MTQKLARPNGPTRSDSKCRHCGGTLKLFGIEPHPTVARKELRTYVCRQCDQIRTETVPLPASK